VTAGNADATESPLITAMTATELAVLGQLSREILCRSCAAAFLQAGRRASADAARNLWKSPTVAELGLRRVPDHRLCPAECGRCSRCIHAASWLSRGSRPYLGVDGEFDFAMAALDPDRTHQGGGTR
jgi:hypothetical protein